MSAKPHWFWPAIIAAAVLAGASGWWLGDKLLRPASKPLPAGFEVIAIGQRVPDLGLRDLDGRPQPMPKAPILINFWASWCGPCIKEMPIFEAYFAQQASNGTQVIGIALDDLAAAKSFLATRPVSFPIYIEPNRSTDSSVKLGNTSAVLPYTVLIGADGRLLAKHAGPFKNLTELSDWVTSR